jgi:hypothetical protein
MVDTCERCSVRHLCRSSTSACPDLWDSNVVTSGTRLDPRVQEEEPIDDQVNNVWDYWPHHKQRRTMRDTASTS